MFSILFQDLWQVQNANSTLSKEYRAQFEVNLFFPTFQICEHNNTLCVHNAIAAILGHPWRIHEVLGNSMQGAEKEKD